MLTGETTAGVYPELTVQTMARICKEAESAVNYGATFKRIMQTHPVPMSPLEPSFFAIHAATNSVGAALILVLTRGGSTTKMVANLTFKTENFDWLCSDEALARHSLIVRGLVPVLSAGSIKASDAEATKEALVFSLRYAKEKGFCKVGDSVVALHRVGAASVIKMLTIK
ncbi:hypothetical protein IFM89_006158 [Coptis chinensis]|uniref:Pyruvate kinase C-terminal domain-containing protein n=1 Tax=Coptis chinensis TaxID=261450 RepID=A0A835LDL2_9MAGN|nr:hypothetical protein IFM89_006158 [Coptis chinensis]